MVDHDAISKILGSTYKPLRNSSTGVQMQATALVGILNDAIAQHGETLNVVFQDTPSGGPWERCKHESFYVVIEPTDDGVPEVVLRTWPY